MPKITGGVTAALLAALIFTGCTAAPPAAPEPTPSQTSAPAAEAPAEARPLVAETPATSGSDTAGFLKSVHELLPAQTQIPNATDEQLLAAGWEACDRMAAGETSDTMILIEGETVNPETGMHTDSVAIMLAAVRQLCP